MINASQVALILSMGLLPNPKKEYASSELRKAVEEYNRAHLELELRAHTLHVLAINETVSER